MQADTLFDTPAGLLYYRGRSSEGFLASVKPVYEEAIVYTSGRDFICRFVYSICRILHVASHNRLL